MKYARIYFVKGVAPRDKNLTSKWLQFAIKDPPVAGNTMCFILGGTGKKLTIFHPTSLQAYRVSPECTEIKAAEEKPLTRPQLMVDVITKNWAMYKELDMQRSYDVAAQVLIQLGAPVPEYVEPSDDRRGKMPDFKTAGKEMDMTRFKTVKRKGRKGAVAEFFGTDGKPILEAMAILDMTRSAVLSQLYMLWKDHGIGYQLYREQVKLLSEHEIFEDDDLEIDLDDDIELDDEDITLEDQGDEDRYILS